MFFFLLDSTEGYIKSASNEVLGVLDGKKDAGNKVLLELVNESMEDAQMWIRDKEAPNGWFTLRNKASGKLLTAKTNTTVTIEGKFDNFKNIYHNVVSTSSSPLGIGFFRLSKKGKLDVYLL